MRTRARRASDPVGDIVSAALATPGRTLGPERAALEQRLGGDLGALRVHEGPEIDRASGALGARGFALGRDVALSSHARPATLAHEAAHALQQDMAPSVRGLVPVAPAGDPAEAEAERAATAGGPLTRGAAPRIQLDFEDTGRLATVHENVRVKGPPRTTPAGPPAKRKPWVDPTAKDGGTADLLFKQAYKFLNDRDFTEKATVNTTEKALDADAVAMNKRVLDRFPQITSPLSDEATQKRVGIFKKSTIENDKEYLGQWVDNFLDQMSDSEEYDIDVNNTHYRAMVDKLIADPDVGPKIVTLGLRQPAFTRTTGKTREVFVHPSVEATKRKTTLIHEIVHFYRNDRYYAWVEASKSEPFYNEGLTEWLARKVMTSDELAGRSDYQARVDQVEKQIAAFVPESDIIRAFFAGEVWRLETRSKEARTAFETDTGIKEGSSVKEEGAASRAGAGLFQTVQPGVHYRFLNLGRDEAQPKPEHETAFQNVKADQLDTDSALKVRFVGHASTPGSEATNRALALRRSVAFYRMARRDGVPWNRMIGADRPPHFGEAQPTVVEEDAITRAMNRRVEMFLIRKGAP